VSALSTDDILRLVEDARQLRHPPAVYARHAGMRAFPFAAVERNADWYRIRDKLLYLPRSARTHCGQHRRDGHYR